MNNDLYNWEILQISSEYSAYIQNKFTDLFSLLNHVSSIYSYFYIELTNFWILLGIWRVNFICNGTTGHGSLLHENTAGEKLRHILDRMMDYRTEQAEKLKNNPKLSIGDVTTVNLTIIKGGLQSNVVIYL